MTKAKPGEGPPIDPEMMHIKVLKLPSLSLLSLIMPLKF
jgi:hypothetical protein